MALYDQHFGRSNSDYMVYTAFAMEASSISEYFPVTSNIILSFNVEMLGTCS